MVRIIKIFICNCIFYFKIMKESMKKYRIPNQNGEEWG